MDGHSELKRLSTARTSFHRRDDFDHRLTLWDGTWPGESAPRAEELEEGYRLQVRAMGARWLLLCECEDVAIAGMLLAIASTVGCRTNEPAQYQAFMRTREPVSDVGSLGFLGMHPISGRVLMTMDVAACDDERPAFMSGAVVFAHAIGVPLPYVVVKQVHEWTPAAQ